MFLESGVKIYEYQENVKGEPQALHSKTITVDEIYCSIGSSNLDLWSLSWNLEANLTSFNPRLASRLNEYFYSDISRSREVTIDSLNQRSIFHRIIHWTAYQILRLFLR